MIEAGFEEFRAVFHQKPYEKQKSSLEKRFLTFLSSLQPPKTLRSCSGADVVKFLISLDSGGKTVVHRLSCPRGGTCACPRWLAAGTVHNNVGKLRAIFNNLGCLAHKNPASLVEVKRYVVFTREEQAKAALVPRQAVPMVTSTLTQLVDHLLSCLHSPSSSPIQRYLIVRDRPHLFKYACRRLYK